MWIYNETVKDQEAVQAAIDVSVCIFCQTKLRTIDDGVPIYPSSTTKTTFTVDFCPMCGWWKKRRDEFTAFHFFNLSDSVYGAIGSLRELDITDQSLPIEEIRSYLAIKYDERFNIDPWKLEDVVASVYKHLGYHTRVTARSGDGGIDVVLDGPNHVVIGVQVKRYRAKIKVEQIRAFVGALYLKRMTRGIFVTTSSFQLGADKVAKLSKLRGIPIELVDAERFYQALGIAQRAAYQTINDCSAPFWTAKLKYLKNEII
jgi:restriction system protein